MQVGIRSPHPNSHIYVGVLARMPTCDVAIICIYKILQLATFGYQSEVN